MPQGRYLPSFELRGERLRPDCCKLNTDESLAFQEDSLTDLVYFGEQQGSMGQIKGNQRVWIKHLDEDLGELCDLINVRDRLGHGCSFRK